MAFASGKHAIAICDRCGFEYKYLSLKREWTGFRVCSECFEVKHPQLEPINHIADPEALRFPRPSASATSVAGAGVVRTIDANQMMSTTGDVIGSEFTGVAGNSAIGTISLFTKNVIVPRQDAATGEIGTVTVVIT